MSLTILSRLDVKSFSVDAKYPRIYYTSNYPVLHIDKDLLNSSSNYALRFLVTSFAAACSCVSMVSRN